MSITFTPVNKITPLELPIGFHSALFIETPANKLYGCYYTRPPSKSWYNYGHSGVVGESWFSDKETRVLYDTLAEYTKSNEYQLHPYFNEKYPNSFHALKYRGKSIRHNQMVLFLAFLKECGGFKINF